MFGVLILSYDILEKAWVLLSVCECVFWLHLTCLGQQVVKNLRAGLDLYSFWYFDIKDKGKAKEELADSIKNLNIEESSRHAGSSATNFRRKPVIIIVIGMAGNFQ